MSTLPRPTGRDLIRALERHGFAVVRIRGSHHVLRHPDGRTTVVPARPHTLGIGLLRKIMADCQLSAESLQELLS